MVPEYREGRAEGLAIAFISILDVVADIDRYEYPHTTIADMAGYIATNAAYKQERVLDRLVEAIRAEQVRAAHPANGDTAVTS